MFRSFVISKHTQEPRHPTATATPKKTPLSRHGGICPGGAATKADKCGALSGVFDMFLTD